MPDPVMVEYERRLAISNGYQAMPMPDEQQIKDGAHILSEILDDAAPLNEQRYRFPAREMLRYAAWLKTQNGYSDADALRDLQDSILQSKSVADFVAVKKSVEAIRESEAGQ